MKKTTINLVNPQDLSTASLRYLLVQILKYALEGLKQLDYIGNESLQAIRTIIVNLEKH